MSRRQLLSDMNLAADAKACMERDCFLQLEAGLNCGQKRCKLQLAKLGSAFIQCRLNLQTPYTLNLNFEILEEVLEHA